MKKSNYKRQAFTEEFLKELHSHCHENEEGIRNSKKCGCFCCMEIYDAKEVILWYNERSGKKTAVCPYCMVDAILGDSCGVEITPELLKAMNNIWF